MATANAARRRTESARSKPGYERVVTPEAIAFVVELERKFGAERKRLLARRQEVQAKLDAGWKPDFLPETQAIRDADWTVAPLPKDLLDRRVEITGPTDRKMVINALNSGSSVFMADFEDANTPSWANLIEGHINLMDAVRRDISFDDPANKRHYQLNPRTAVLLVRPRGWHLPEAHVIVDGQPMSGSLFDFGLYFFHNAKESDGAQHRALFLSAQDGERITRRGCGTRCSSTPRPSSACPKAPSRRRC